MSDAIFIVGYYRSGTSALSGALQRLGVKLFNEADPNEHNPLGFFEIPELIEFDVDLFNRLGVEWTDVRGLPEGWWDRADIASYCARLEEIIRRRFGPGDAVWGLKHPHLCRALPLYERAARQAGHTPHVVHMLRDPWTAAASQQHKNGLTRAHALLLWMSYVTSGERQARHLPRSWVTYHDLLTAPRGEFKRIEGDTGLALSRLLPGGAAAAADYLTEQLNRSAPVPHEDLAWPLRDLVGRAWGRILARDFSPAVWDGLAAETADIVGFLNEIGASRGRVIPSFGAPVITGAPRAAATATGLRPPERADAAARARLLQAAERIVLPRVGIVIVAPAGRAHAVNETLEALRGQWHAPAAIAIVTADPLALPGQDVTRVSDAPGAATIGMGTALLRMAGAGAADYLAVLNAGDTVSPDACLRLALAAGAQPAMLYCDEIVPRDGGAWVRHKPGWDVTRLRQSAYLGDWVWYRAAEFLALGGFDAARAGAEDYDYQLRLAETCAAVVRLPEALFTRSAQARRDEIKAEVFCARAAAAVAAHLARLQMPAEVQHRQHLGLFHHLRSVPDPGTSIIILCDGGEVPALDAWMSALLGGGPLSGPVILAGSALSAPMQAYLAAVTAQAASLGAMVVALPWSEALRPGAVLADAVALATTPHVAILDVRAEVAAPHWLAALRQRLADPGVAMVGARALVRHGGQARQFNVQGPIVCGASNRLGTGHLADDPGPGGWLIVDQEASAVAPPGLLARRAALAACRFADLNGDALWIDIGAQLREAGGRIVWTPDVSFTVPAEAIIPDLEHDARQSGLASQLWGWTDPYHHPALSLHGDVLAAEQRLGLVPAAPDDAHRLLVSGPPESGGAVLNAVRALREAGQLAADWAPEPLAAADLGRAAPSGWVRVNPERAAAPLSPPYAAVFTSAPAASARAAIAGAASLFATSPNLVAAVSALGAPGQRVHLARPGLSGPLWQGLRAGTGLNTKPRVLWFDEGVAPDWFADLINETIETAAWIVIERPGTVYTGSVARIAAPPDEAGWARVFTDLAPQIMVRPVADASWVDHYPILLGAAAGCHVLADDRLDVPPGLGAVRLGNRYEAWQRALREAVHDLPATLARGARARAAALALPTIEDAPPAWAQVPVPDAAARRAAE
jgi:hypothetical protein